MLLARLPLLCWEPPAPTAAPFLLASTHLWRDPPHHRDTSGFLHHQCLTRWLNHITVTLSWTTSRDCQGATEVAFMQVTFFFFFHLEKGLTPDVRMVSRENVLCLTSFQIRIKERSCPSQTSKISKLFLYKCRGQPQPVLLIPYSLSVNDYILSYSSLPQPWREVFFTSCPKRSAKWLWDAEELLYFTLGKVPPSRCTVWLQCHLSNILGFPRRKMRFLYQMFVLVIHII